MAEVVLRAVRKSFGRTEVIQGVDLTVKDGEFLVFVGPSGCGKSTLLRLIAGLEDITDGELLIDGEVVNDRTPKERGIAMVSLRSVRPVLEHVEHLGIPLDDVLAAAGLDCSG